MAPASGGQLPPRDDDAGPAFLDPHCTYYIPRSQLPDHCDAQCQHCGNTCTLAADHGEGFTSSLPNDGPSHVCFRCFCVYSPVTHFHDGRMIYTK